MADKGPDADEGTASGSASALFRGLKCGVLCVGKLDERLEAGEGTWIVSDLLLSCALRSTSTGVLIEGLTAWKAIGRQLASFGLGSNVLSEASPLEQELAR